MSGHLDCPACHIREAYDAAGNLYLRDAACTHRAGCVELNKLVAGALRDTAPGLDETLAREERIAAAREAVLEACRLAYLGLDCGFPGILTATGKMIRAEVEEGTP